MALRVLLIFQSVDRFEQFITNELPGRGVEVHVVHDGRHGALHPGLDANIPQYVVPCPSRLNRTAIRRIRGILSATQFDVVHAFMSRSLAVTLFATRGLRPMPKIVAHRSYIGHAHRFDPLARMTYQNRRIDHIIGNSEPVVEYLREQGIPASRLSTIYKTISPDWLITSNAPPLTELGVPQGAFTVCFIGNTARRKALDVLLDAMPHLAEDKSIHLLVIGRVADPKIQRLAEERARSGQVHLLGFRPDAVGILNQCDVFVLPSRSEALGRSMMEAMTLGIPPIVTDTGGSSVVVRHEVDGLVVPVEDAEALAHAIRRMKERPDERRRMGNSAKERIARDFPLETKADELIAVYEKVLGRRGAEES